MRAEIVVVGIVQGVGFRPFVYRIAVENHLAGVVQNCGDASVKIVVEGESSNIDEFLKELDLKKPPLSKIYNKSVSYFDNTDEFKNFSILKSLNGGDKGGSVIPPDISICDDCIIELRNPSDRRYKYFFITCTNCGPRYTIVEKLPYDRPNTTMKEFPLCKECDDEYVNPLDRRFHAQTVACDRCGPKVELVTNKGEPVCCEDPIREAGKFLDKGRIIAFKGNGGFHIACATTISEPIIRLRQSKFRAQKPFAIMGKNLDVVKSFAEISMDEELLLTSYKKPIILLNKNSNYYLSEYIAPELHNVGVMLPYNGMHILLFDSIKEPALVMTSANHSDLPIITTNCEALNKLSDDVDFFLLHNRRIAQRCDDSVVKNVSEGIIAIRRSRGYTPEPIYIKRENKKNILALGAEQNVTVCILNGHRAYLSQHIGDIENVETLAFLKDATSHMLEFTKNLTDTVVCDLHPAFLTTKYGFELAGEKGLRLQQIQHHHAHIASVMGEHDLMETIGIACDGIGYGQDGSIWGGEIFFCSKDECKRLAHLQEQPMIGGDLATKYPLRMLAGILDLHEGAEWLFSKADQFPYGRREVEVVLQQLKHGRFLKTSSCGRILDAVSALLGICLKRTYEGEPSIKLESEAICGKDILNLEPLVKDDVLDTSFLIKQIFHNIMRYRKQDLAYSAHVYIARGLASMAIEHAERLGVKSISFSGGMAYNEHITSIVKKEVDAAGLSFFRNLQVPPGDGGISFGQTVAVIQGD